MTPVPHGLSFAVCFSIAAVPLQHSLWHMCWGQLPSKCTFNRPFKTLLKCFPDLFLRFGSLSIKTKRTIFNDVLKTLHWPDCILSKDVWQARVSCRGEPGKWQRRDLLQNSYLLTKEVSWPSSCIIWVEKSWSRIPEVRTVTNCKPE